MTNSLIKYTIEILSEGKTIKGFTCPCMSLPPKIMDKENFKDMLFLIDYTSTVFMEAESMVIKATSEENLTLRIFSEETVVFDSIQAFEAYKTKHHIQAWTDSSFNVYITVNGIRFHGEAA